MRNIYVIDMGSTPTNRIGRGYSRNRRTAIAVAKRDSTIYTHNVVTVTRCGGGSSEVIARYQNGAKVPDPPAPDPDDDADYWEASAAQYDDRSDAEYDRLHAEY